MSAIRLLYVDDDDDIREIAMLCFEFDGGFETRDCASGREAIGLVSDWQPDIILLDVMMPDMDGPDTLRALRDLPGTAAVPIVFITARTHTDEVDRFLALGARGVIAKPFHPATLAGDVRSLFEANNAAPPAPPPPRATR